MKNRGKFRPSVTDSTLEDRIVLSQSPVPSLIVNAYVSQFRTQFDGISSGLTNAVTTTLLGGNNSTPTTASRTAYDTQVADLLNQADTTLGNVLSLSPLAQQKFTGQVDQILTGTDSTSLGTELNALTTPTATGTPVTTFTTDSTNLVSAALKEALVDLDSFFSASNPARQQIGKNGSAPISVKQSYNNQFTQEFTTFSSNYTTDVTSILLTGTNAATIPANRAAFDTQVSTDANTLDSDLADMLSLFPNATKTLSSAIDQRLISGTNSMLVQLNALTTPTDLSGTTAQAFQTQATSIINSAQTDVLALLNKEFQAFA